MQRNLAEKLINESMRIGDHLNTISEVVSQIDDMEERRKFARPLGELMGLIYTELMLPIIKDYPDLDPDKNQ